MHRYFASIGVLLAAAMLVPSAAASPCVPKLVETFPLVRLVSGRYAVQASIDGHPLRLMVETGASDSVLADTMGDSLGLTRQAITNDNSSALGGRAIRQYVIAENVFIGHLKADRMKFLLLPGTQEETDGLLGVDVLSKFDVELDFPRLRMTLYEQGTCGIGAVSWANGSEVTTVPFRIEMAHIKFDAILDGQHVTAWLDTGAWRNHYSLEAAEASYGLDEKAIDMRRLGNLNNPHPSYLHIFKSLVIGNQTISTPEVMLMPNQVAQLSVPEPRFLVGIPTLSKFHLFIAFGEQKFYVTSEEAP